MIGNAELEFDQVSGVLAGPEGRFTAEFPESPEQVLLQLFELSSAETGFSPGAASLAD
jgi:hypothetical protein